MMDPSVYFSKNYWTPYLAKKLLLVKSFFMALGVIWLIIAISTYFFSDLPNLIKCYWWLCLLLFPAVWSIVDNRPKLFITQRLPQRDIKIEIRVADIFDLKGAYIIGTNTTFDTEIGNDLISETSIQGQFTKKFYHDYHDLDDVLTSQLAQYPSTVLPLRKKGKHRSYEMGSVVKITTVKGPAYLLAMAVLNDNGVAGTTLEDIKISLSKLWTFISTNGGTEPVIIPILGSNYGRLLEQRDQIINEIARSFILACATRKFTEKLIIVIHPEDYIKWNLDLNDLKTILEYQCRFSKF